VFELGENLLAEPDLASLLTSAAEVVASVINSDVVAIIGLGSDQRSMYGLAAAGLDSAVSMQSIVDQPDPATLEAIRSGRVVVVRDLLHDRRYDAPAEGVHALLSGIMAPIYNSPRSLAGEGRVGAFGVLTVRSWKPRAFRPAQVQLVEDVATLLSRMLTLRASEQAIRESEERFRLLAERSPDVVVLTRMIPQPRLEYVSPSIQDLIGYSADEVLHGEDRSRIWAIIHPDDREKGRAYIANPLAAASPLLLRWIHRDGSVVWTEQRMTPILDQGRLVAIEGVIRDVTHRVLQEQRWQALADVTQLILEGRQTSEILQAAAGHLTRLSGADHALLAFPLRGRPEWTVRVMSGDAAQSLDEVVLPDADPLIARVTTASAAVVIEDTSTALPLEHPLRRLGWTGPGLFAPIRTADGVLGILGLANVAQGRRFSHIGMAALGDFARQAALAIEYGRARDDLQRLAVLEDRARISRELHDGVIQSLFGAGMILEGITETTDVPPATRDGIARVAQMIDNTMVDVRSYIFDLRPSTLTGRNIEEGLRLLAEDFEKASSIPCSVEVEAGALVGLEGAAPQLIQIAREALSNVARHSHASACYLGIRREGANTLIEIRDDGRGFKPAQTSGGSGLKNMRKRAAQIGARVEFISEPGKGSIVRIHTPSPPLKEVPVSSRIEAPPLTANPPPSSVTTTPAEGPPGGKVKA
jgi:PAS domain S-box-containing protein